jgi:nitrite reductase/ring-hydroxylating ferredoxin subunit
MHAPAVPLIGARLGRGPAKQDDPRRAEAGIAVEVCSEEELDRCGRLVVGLLDPPIDVLVVRARGRVFAVENRCPHLGSRLDSGDVRGRTITCAAHSRRFDLITGRCMSEPGRRVHPLVTLRTWVNDGRVWVAAPRTVG